MIDVLKVQKYLADMYSEKDVTEEEIKNLLEKYPERAKQWEEEFKDNSTEEVIAAIKEYWKYKDSKVKPKIVHLKALITTSEEYIEPQKDYSELAKAAKATAERLRQEVIKKYGI